MELFFLGTGTAIPVRQHTPSGLFIIAAGQKILLDIGPGTLSRLELAGFSCTELDALLITHFHSDHTLDLATLLQVFNYSPGSERSAPFTIITCPGMDNFYHHLLKLYPELSPLSYDLRIKQVFVDKFSVGDVRVNTAPTGHTPESIAYRLEDGNHSLVYSGDAAPTGKLAQLSDKADMLICECSFPAGWDTEDHLNADTAGIIARQAGVKSLVLTHTYPPAQAVDLVTQVHRHFDGIVQVAVDGLHLSL